MATSPHRLRVPLIVLSLMICQGAMVRSQTANGLQVPFVLLRLDPATLDVRGAYQYEQPYRKSLLPECNTNTGHGCLRIQAGDQYILLVSPSDFGQTTLVSRLTGQRTFDATSIWAGTGELIWPTAAEATTDLSRGVASPEPTLFTAWSEYGEVTESIARQAWDSVKDLQIIASLAVAPYGVFVTSHYYDVFGPQELILLVYGKPMAPLDAGLVKMLWPADVLTEGVPASPEVRIHNFSDEAIDVDIDLEVAQGQSIVRRLRQSVSALEADGELIVTFDTFVPVGTNPMSFRARLSRPGGSSWSDAFQDNDALDLAVDSIRLPVYRAFPRAKFPLPAFSIDFDGDADLDVVTWEYNPRFLRNDQGAYVDVTSRVSATLPHRPGVVLAHDMTGDGVVDVLLDSLLLAGDGQGNFTDVTASSAYPGTGTVHDIDEDGDLDVFTTLNGAVRVYQNDGAGHFTDETDGSGIEPIASRAVRSIGQVSGDGRPDLVLAGWTTLSSVYENLGGGSFVHVADLPDSKLTRDAVIIDYDRDGLPDLFLAGFSDNRLLRQESPLSFVDVSSTAGPLGGFGPALPFDIDDDGWTDLAIDFPFRLLHNAGGLFQDESRLLVAREDTSLGSGRLVQPQFLDLDADGDDDINFFSAAFENQGRPRPTVQPLVERHDTGSSRFSLIAHGSPAFDVRSIILSSIAIGPDGAAPAHPNCGHLNDTDKDGYEDILFHARFGDAGLLPGQSACLEGVLTDGTRFRGCETTTARVRSRRAGSGSRPSSAR